MRFAEREDPGDARDRVRAAMQDALTSMAQS
jgi:hypothetical protein